MHKHTIFMNENPNNDNKYPVGSLVYAKAFPEQKLFVDAYKQRIYYCGVVDHPEVKQFAYFERELLPPTL
jgi:hypothetical protein